jgi:hypothetical protein
MNYWEECIEAALIEAGITATPEQISIIAGNVEVAHENYGLAHGHDCIPNPIREELHAIQHKLDQERSKVLCRVCKGTGRSYGSWCDKCGGEGRHLP